MKQIKKLIITTIFILLLSTNISKAATMPKILHAQNEQKSVITSISIASTQLQEEKIMQLAEGQKGRRPNTATKYEAPTTGTSELGTDKVDPDDFIPNDLTEDDYEVAFNMTKTIVNAITIVGIVISVIMVMDLGIKYILASVEERADYKKTMIPMIIGAVLLFTSSTLVSVIYSIISQVE